MARRLSPEDRETTIFFDEVDDAAEVFTYQQSLISSLLKLGLKPAWINKQGGHRFTVPKSWVAIKPPQTRTKRPGQRAPSRIDFSVHSHGNLPCSQHTSSRLHTTSHPARRSAQIAIGEEVSE